MAQGSRGFGAIGGFPGNVVPDSMPMPTAQDPNQFSDDIHRMVEKYDGQPVEDLTPFNLAPGEFMKRDFSQSPFSSIIVSVNAGSVEVFFGDYSGSQYASTVGHFTVPSGGAPWQGLFATLGRIITVRNLSTAAATAPGCLSIVRP